MAGDWIKFEKTLPGKPEVVRISSACGADRFSVAARLCVVWGWAEELTEDGVIRGASADDLLPVIDDIAGIPGFAKAMAAAGWLVHEDGKPLSFPNFDIHNTKTAKRRATEQRRKKGARDADGERRKESASDADKKRTREEKNKKETTSLSGGPPIDDERRKPSASDADTTRTDEKGTAPLSGGPSPAGERGNPIRDAVIAAWFPTGVSEGQWPRVGKIIKQLNTLGVDATTVGRAIEGRIEVMRQRMPKSTPTPEAILKHWDALNPDKQPETQRERTRDAERQQFIYDTQQGRKAQQEREDAFKFLEGFSEEQCEAAFRRVMEARNLPTVAGTTWRSFVVWVAEELRKDAAA